MEPILKEFRSTVVCPKCASTALLRTHRDEDERFPEHLKVVCVCGYSWREKCADTKKGEEEIVPFQIVEENTFISGRFPENALVEINGERIDHFPRFVKRGDVIAAKSSTSIFFSSSIFSEEPKACQ